MLHKIYNFAWHIAPPIIKHYLRKRAQKNPEYSNHWGERFGEPHPNPVQRAIWLHAVSVGETRAAQPLITQLKQHFPNAPILLTQMTPTGRATAQTLFPEAQCRYLPYDNPQWVQQFIREHRPIFGVLMETEIWANLIQECKRENVPLFLANARLSEKSQQGYQKIQSFIAPALGKLSGCYAQTAEDAARLQTIGAVPPVVCGNTKYDIAIPEQSIELATQFREKIGKRRVFLAASLREKNGVDEAELILRAWQYFRQPEDLLILVPRHPERFQAACDLVQQFDLTIQKRSDNQAVQPETAVWVGDSMGEMWAYYQVADVVFVGGSLVDTGCQNIIEPMTCGKPVLFGQSVYNFQAACDGALRFGAAKQIADVNELLQTVRQWLDNPEDYAAITTQARQFVAQHQGASARIAQQIIDKLKAS
ncbi:lipid IV(A) 3-deoxy-D-manno-octulosonic acid transferase [Alysiella crassa]|uniref:3-deoxy-D-manno-octulosonic acid transferase n=1 Tax=Alysiella crassa TaxID=153491 RepID=A0A376BK06_9NEIS|nr:lipid IV(A) 3-deoxy-D-manno-octulosonic acid transferase [Alysiella crassa]UOP07790.1 lipid IV(A) 3-deoxy-D-manno-octulosonic acid transferase [Alysiella crassa]SSY69965.1 3-deoxy-D-manno-octulosonic-acid transferase [Alysiella crassa]